MRNHSVALLLSSPIISAGLQSILRSLPGISVTEINAGAVSPDTYRQRIADLRPSVVITDIYLSPTLTEGFPTLLMATAQVPHETAGRYAGVLSVFDSRQSIAERIRTLCEPSRQEDQRADDLSPREREVVLGIVKGYSNKEIAAEMNVSVNTIMTHRRNIAVKLQIHSPAGLTIFALATGMVKLEDIRNL